MSFFYDSFNPEYKMPFGCVSPGEKCRIIVKEDGLEQEGRLFFEIYREDGFALFLPMTKMQDSFLCEFSLSKAGLYFYRFRLKTCGYEVLLGMGEDRKKLCENGAEFQISCIPKEFETPQSFRGKIMYQIFPDRFFKSGECDLSNKLTPFRLHENLKEDPVLGPDFDGSWNNDFYGGNLKGIEEKLPYLASLGVGILYLNPIFFAFSNHRYDTADYKRIDPLLGNERDFISLCKAAHRLGMKVILDGVFSHVGADSIYFDAKHRFGSGAVSSASSSYREWFDFQNYPDRYTCWWNILTLPCVKEMTPSYLEYVIDGKDSVIEHWMSLGADGFRLDVADELPDEFIQRLRKKMKAINKDSFLIGEVWEDASNKISYGIRRTYFTCGELDSVMNYPFRQLILSLFRREITAEKFEIGVMTILEHYPSQVLPCLMNSLSTHDTPRIRSELASFLQEDTVERALYAAAFLQFLLPGIPCIYYGDEVGMAGERDPLNRRYFEWGKENGNLTEFYKKLGELRSENPVLQTGGIQFVSSPGRLEWIRGEEFHAAIVLDPTVSAPIKENGILEKLSVPCRKFDFSVWREKNVDKR